MFRRFILPTLVWLFYRGLTASWRKNLIESEDLKLALQQKRPVIFAHWHGDELAITHLVNKYSIATMTSTSKDGELIDFVIRRLGGKTSRGSSTRGAVSALKGLVRICRSGYNASMAVDGPKGPLHKVKPGAFELAHLTKGIIVPVGVAADKKFIFKKSWNQASLPHFFSRLVVLFGPSFPLPADGDLKSPALAERLEAELNSTRLQAEKILKG